MSDDDVGLIAFCGLHCGDCPLREGRIAGLARDLREELARAHFDRSAEALSAAGGNPAFSGYREFVGVLGALASLHCLAACRSDGGNPRCPIRACARGRRLEGCWECATFEACDKLAALETAHGDAALRNLRAIRREGKDAFARGRRHWYSEPGGGTRPRGD